MSSVDKFSKNPLKESGVANAAGRAARDQRAQRLIPHRVPSAKSEEGIDPAELAARKKIAMGFSFPPTVTEPVLTPPIAESYCQMLVTA